MDLRSAVRSLLRVPGVEALARWPGGAAILIGFKGAEPVVFPA